MLEQSFLFIEKTYHYLNLLNLLWSKEGAFVYFYNRSFELDIHAWKRVFIDRIDNKGRCCVKEDRSLVWEVGDNEALIVFPLLSDKQPADGHWGSGVRARYIALNNSDNKQQMTRA